MNIERFHNELAMRLGYERSVKDNRILISVVESDNPWVTLKIDGAEVIRFKASEELEEVAFDLNCEMRDKIKWICDAVHQAYLESTRVLYTCHI